MSVREEHRKSNRLANEKSPYLLQHANNPVDWYPWSEEAFEKAKKEEKPVFLSIGYSTCHWCHVMERESFEDNDVAGFLNENFVAIKVDREERPDVDHIYMSVCQAMTGSGGWPLSVFLTPDKEPFFAGTYFPKEDRMGMTGFMSLLKLVSDSWKDNRQRLLETGKQVTDILKSNENIEKGKIPRDIIKTAFQEFKYDFDEVYGGFGRAPKFPTPHNLYFLLRYYHSTKDNDALNIVEKTLESMYKGGIYDHIGFGFSRYSTDRKWLVPHFEKMLYDNALISIAYLEAYQVTHKKLYARIAEEIFEYVLTVMTSPEGGFFSAEDADSEGEEGKFYVFTKDEVLTILGRTAGEEYCSVYGITEKGNFEGRSIPNLINSPIPEDAQDLTSSYRKKLFEFREKRVHPYKDDKVLTSWNGLMIAALAIGGRVLGKKDYIEAAEKSSEFIFSKLQRDDGRLLARYRDGEAAFNAYVDDYAFLIWGLTELYESTFKPFYLLKALTLNKDLIRLFWDETNGGLFVYGSDSEQLITRPKEIYDGATPSGNSVSALNFIRLARMTGNSDLEDMALKIFESFSGHVASYPRGYSFLMTAYLYLTSNTREIVLVSNNSEDVKEIMSAVNENFTPFTNTIVYYNEDDEIKNIAPFLEDYKTLDGKTTAFICENQSCGAPLTGVKKIAESILS